MTQPRRSILCIALLIVPLGLWGCAPSATLVTEDEVARQSAVFDAFPDALFSAVEERCQRPTDKFTRIGPRQQQCESLTTPETAAALILRFEGDFNALPTLVTTLEAEERGAGGFKVTTEYYFRVPTRAGDVAELRIEAPRVQRTIRRFFIAAGGTPI